MCLRMYLRVHLKPHFSKNVYDISWRWNRRYICLWWYNSFCFWSNASISDRYNPVTITACAMDTISENLLLYCYIFGSQNHGLQELKKFIICYSLTAILLFNIIDKKTSTSIHSNNHWICTVRIKLRISIFY